MAIGSLVSIPELQSEGPARLEKQTPGFLGLRFLATGAEMTTESRNVVRYCLLPGTTVVIADGEREREALLGPVERSGRFLIHKLEIFLQGCDDVAQELFFFERQ